MENIDRKHSNNSWRWKHIQSQSKIIMDNLCWEVGTGEKISIKSRFWRPMVGPMPQGIQMISHYKEWMISKIKVWLMQHMDKMSNIKC